MKLCDLHTHSIFSDGTSTPEQSIDLALEIGLSAIALTDHNTVSGLERFLLYAGDKPIDIVPGIEFSTGYKDKELHILGLFVKPEDFGVITEYVKAADVRKEKSNINLAKKLNENGYMIDYQKIKSERPDGKVNRAHFASELVELGYFKTRNEAFDTILHQDYGWYNTPERNSALKTIELIRTLGAVPVWAHPLIHMNYEESDAFLPIAKDYGLVGIETICSLYSDADTEFAKKMCAKHKLLESGGSDFHGANKPDIALGKGKGNLKIPYEFYEKLQEVAK